MLSHQNKLVYIYRSQIHNDNWIEARFHTTGMYLFHFPVSTGIFLLARLGHHTLHIRHGAYSEHKSQGSPLLSLKLLGKVFAVSSGQRRWIHKQVSSNQKDSSTLRDWQDGREDEERKDWTLTQLPLTSDNNSSPGVSLLWIKDVQHYHDGILIFTWEHTVNACNCRSVLRYW